MNSTIRTLRHPLRHPVTRFAAAVALVAAAAVGTVAMAHGGGEGRMGGHGGPMMMHAGMGPGGHGGPGGGAWLGRGLDRMLDGVNATEAQRTQIRQIAEAARTDLQAQRAAAAPLRDQAMTAFTQPNVDANQVEAVRRQMLAQHDATSRRISQAMLDISRVLTPEQRTQLAQRMKERGEHRHRGPMGAPPQGQAAPRS